ncbi:MAG: peptidylprolyl isomerase [Candidatus Dormibacteria bacterium]
MSDTPEPASRTLFVVASTVVAVVVAIIAALAINNANNNVPVGSATTPTPTPAATPTPSASPTPVPSLPPLPPADCTKKSFGADLGPSNPPSDPHVYPSVPAMTIDNAQLYKVTLHTARGDIVLCLNPGYAPTTVNTIVTLVRNKFYDGNIVHRVEPDFVIQLGDPQCKDASQPTCGQGGPGFKFPDEPVRGGYTAGCAAMANSGRNTNGSQFYICTADDTTKLKPLYNLFGYVMSGMDVALKIQKGDVVTTATVAQST